MKNVKNIGENIVVIASVII